jgi:hypothetical protein
MANILQFPSRQRQHGASPSAVPTHASAHAPSGHSPVTAMAGRRWLPLLANTGTDRGMLARVTRFWHATRKSTPWTDAAVIKAVTL